MTGHTRKTTTQLLILTDDPTTSAVIDLRNHVGGRILNSTGGTVTITWYERADAGTPVACGDVSQTVIDDGESAEIPPALFASRYLVPVAGSAAVVTAVLKT